MGNFSRDTFKENNILYKQATGEAVKDPKHYTGIRLQQGVPLLDADWNELEDIEKYERRLLIKWLVGNGVPKFPKVIDGVNKDNDGFKITEAKSDGKSIDFTIKDGICFVDGWDVINANESLHYTEQALYNKKDLADKWGVDVLPSLTFGAGKEYLIYLDVWEREVDDKEDDRIINPAIGTPTCTRLNREWVVRVVEGKIIPTSKRQPVDHVYYNLAICKVIINITSGVVLIPDLGKITVKTPSPNPSITVDPPTFEITDLRRTGLATLSQALTISNDGNVGIGTTDPKARLHVVGDGEVIRIEGQHEASIKWFPKGSAGLEAWVGFDKDHMNSIPGGDAFTIRNNAGRMHIYGTEALYLLNKDGVFIGKEWNGNGNLTVRGSLQVDQEIHCPLWNVSRVFPGSGGPLPLTGTFSSNGGQLLFFASGSGRSKDPEKWIGMKIIVDTIEIGKLEIYAKEAESHKTFVGTAKVIKDIGKGDHNISLVKSNDDTFTDQDLFDLTVMELPFGYVEDPNVLKSSLLKGAIAAGSIPDVPAGLVNILSLPK